MKAHAAEFLRTALQRAVMPVGLFQTATSKICIKDANSDRHLWIETQYVGGRHGCGWEQDGFWAHSNDNDLFAGSHGYTVDVVKQAAGHMVEPIMEQLNKYFADVEDFSVRIEFGPYPGYQALTTLVGDSQSNELVDAPPRARRA